MSESKLSALIAVSLLAAPVAGPAASPVTPSSSLSAEANSPRTAARRMKALLAQAPILEPMGTYVGQLQEQWQYPSDHPMISIQFGGENIASWNVLNNRYMNYVLEKNSQGLSRSQIGQEHVYIGDSKLTVRENHVIDLLLQTLDHPTHPKSVICLQECSETFLEGLRSRLPASYQLVGDKSQEAVIIDKRKFELIESRDIEGIHSEEPSRTVQDLKIRKLDNGHVLRIVNAHVPGDPNKPGRFEFASYIAKTFDSSHEMFVTGDMNFNEFEMADAMNRAFDQKSPFQQFSPYCTNVGLDFVSKAIDHFFVYSPEAVAVKTNSAEETMQGLQAIIDLLEGK